MYNKNAIHTLTNDTNGNYFYDTSYFSYKCNKLCIQREFIESKSYLNLININQFEFISDDTCWEINNPNPINYNIFISHKYVPKAELYEYLNQHLYTIVKSSYLSHSITIKLPVSVRNEIYTYIKMMT